MTRTYEHLIGNQHAKGQKPNSGCFKKGHIPKNKGKKGIHLSPDTEFKKGHKSTRTVSVGTVTIRIDKSGKSRQWIKIEEPNIWIEYTKFIWVKYNGFIPKGYLTHHIDFDSINDDINNIALVTRKAHFEIHRIGELGRKALKIKFLNSTEAH